MKKIRDALGLLLLVAFGLRAAAALVAPVVPLLAVVFILAAAFWIVLGRRRGL